MNVIVDNIKWMPVNIFLALVPVLFGYLMVKEKRIFLKLIFAFIWLIFLPNTIYIYTDLIYLPEHWLETKGIEKILLFMQFFILEIVGFFSFIVSLHYLEKILKKYKTKISTKMNTFLIVLINFFIGAGIVLGREERTNSWEVVLNTKRVFDDSLSIFLSLENLIFIIVAGIFANLVYFVFKSSILEFLESVSNLTRK